MIKIFLGAAAVIVAGIVITEVLYSVSRKTGKSNSDDDGKPVADIVLLYLFGNTAVVKQQSYTLEVKRPITSWPLV